MSKSYRVGEVARHAGVTVEAVRYYERIGVLGPAPRTGRGIRRYPHEAIERIRFVKLAQSIGLRLAEIRELIAVKEHGGTKRCKRVQQLLTAKIVQLDRAARATRRVPANASGACRSVRGITPHGTRS